MPTHHWGPRFNCDPHPLTSTSLPTFPGEEKKTSPHTLSQWWQYSDKGVPKSPAAYPKTSPSLFCSDSNQSQQLTGRISAKFTRRKNYKVLFYKRSVTQTTLCRRFFWNKVVALKKRVSLPQSEEQFSLALALCVCLTFLFVFSHILTCHALIGM